MAQQITQGQIEAFSKSLILHGVLDKAQVSENTDIIEEALKLSASKEGLSMVMYNYTQPVGSESFASPAISASNGQEITRPVHDPIEIFSILYTSKRNRLREEQRKQQEREDKRQDKWSYIVSKPLSERYDVNLGRYLTIDDIKEYQCPHSRCMQSFDTEEEAKKHAWQHYAQSR